MRPIMALGVAVAWAVGGCGLDESGQAALERGGAGGIGGGGGVKDASFGGKPDAGGAPDAALGGNGGSFAGSGGTLSTGGVGGSGGAAGGGGTGGTPIDCSAYPNALEYTLPTGQTHCYWVSAVEADFVDATNDCQSKNGYLASVHSAGEMAIVQQVATPQWYDNEEVWIGGSDGKGVDDPNPGTFGWITNEPWTYANWSLGEPNTWCDKCSGKPCFCEHRLTFYVNDGRWSDRSDDNPFRFVCEAGQLVQ